MVWRRLRALLPILSWYRILPRVPIQPDGPESGFWVETKPSQVFTVAATPALLALDRFKRRSCRERLGDVRDLALDRQARCRTRAAKIGGLIQTRSFILPFRSPDVCTRQPGTGGKKRPLWRRPAQRSASCQTSVFQRPIFGNPVTRQWRRVKAAWAATRARPGRHAEV